MPKPILVFNMGRVDPERVVAYANFMQTSEYTQALRDEYHLVIRDQTADEKCYILSIDQPPYDIDPVPHTINKLKDQLSAYDQSNVKPTLASGGVVSGPSFGNTDHGPEMIVPLPSASQKVKDALKQMHAIRDAARFLIAELKKGWTAKEIAEWYNVPDIKIGDSWPKTGYPPKEVREMEEKSTVKDPNEKASFFGYNIRRSTMQDIESAMLTGSLLRLGSISENELIIRREYTDPI